MEKEEKTEDDNAKAEPEKEEAKAAIAPVLAENITHIINLLSFIGTLQTVKKDVHLPVGLLKAASYGPKEWTFTTVQKIPSIFTVLKVNDRSDVHIILKPLVPANFTTVDELIKHLQSCVERVMHSALQIFAEGTPINLEGQLAQNPEDIGIPLSEISESNFAPEVLINRISPMCETRRHTNVNFSTGRLAEGIDLSQIREALIAVSRNEMRPLQETIRTHLISLNDGTVDDKDFVFSHSNVMHHIIASPFRLNLLFDHIPESVRYSSSLVMEVISPEVSLSPVPPTTIMVTGSKSASRTTTLSAISGINERPQMDEAMGYFMMGLLAPGSVNFSISFDDIPATDIYLRCFAALACKLLFSFSINPRWNSITQGSVRTVEMAIVKAGLQGGVLVPAGRDAGAYPLANVLPLRQAGVEHMEFLVTNDNGAGWRGGRRTFCTTSTRLPLHTLPK